ncbi:MAG: cell division protein FtsQ/DivIB [Sulfuriferula sp.]
MWDDEAALARLTRWSLLATALIVLWALLVLASRLPWFDLRQIKVNGAQHVTREQVNLVVYQHLRGNFFSVNLDSARTAFTKLPWVRSASVRRHWPDGLEVTLEEHKPLARWGDEGLLNTYGEIFQAATAQKLPLLSGPTGSEKEVAQRYADFTRILLPLHHRPVEVNLSARRAWSISLDDGMSIALGREHMDSRLASFVELYPRTLANVATPVKYVDLRYPNGFAVRVPVAAIKHAGLPNKQSSRNQLHRDLIHSARLVTGQGKQG